MAKLEQTQEMAWHRNQYVRWIMRNIDRIRVMSLEEIAPYFVHRTIINKSEVWYSPRACLKNKNCTKRMFYFPFS